MMEGSSLRSYDSERKTKSSMSMAKSAKKSEPSRIMTGLASIGSSISNGISGLFKSKPKASEPEMLSAAEASVPKRDTLSSSLRSANVEPQKAMMSEMKCDMMDDMMEELCDMEAAEEQCEMGAEMMMSAAPSIPFAAQPVAA